MADEKRKVNINYTIEIDGKIVYICDKESADIIANKLQELQNAIRLRL